MATLFSYRASGVGIGSGRCPGRSRMAGDRTCCPPTPSTSNAQTATRRSPPSGNSSDTAGRTPGRNPLLASCALIEPLRKLACRSTSAHTAERSHTPVTCARTRLHRKSTCRITSAPTVARRPTPAHTVHIGVLDRTCWHNIWRCTLKTSRQIRVIRCVFRWHVRLFWCLSCVIRCYHDSFWCLVYPLASFSGLVTVFFTDFWTQYSKWS